MARVLNIELPPIEYMDDNSSGIEDPTVEEIAAANAFAKEFAKRKGLVIAQDAHIGNIIPKFIDAKTGKEFKGDYTNIPKSQIANYVPPSVKALEWDDKANLPYFTNEQTGDVQYVPQDYFFLPRFNPNRGKPMEDLIVKK